LERGKQNSPQSNPSCLKFFCKRDKKKTPCNLYGKNVLLTAEEYSRLVSDLGEDLAKKAIDEYDRRYPNSPAIQKHTNHNLAIRDYLDRGFICKAGGSYGPSQGEIRPQTKPKNEYDPKKYEVAPEDVSTPEELAELKKVVGKIGRSM